MLRKPITLLVNIYLLIYFLAISSSNSYKLPSLIGTKHEGQSAQFIFKKSLLPLATAVGIFLNCQLPSLASSGVAYEKSPSGIEYYDYNQGSGDKIERGDKIKFHYKGRLAGRQGWIFDDTKSTDTPVRMTVGVNRCIKGLELGLLGDDSINGMPPMRMGGKRRLVIPAKLGYKDRDELPIPAAYDQQQRLYSTVLNTVRIGHETEAFGDSLVGKLVLDVDVIRVQKQR